MSCHLINVKNTDNCVNVAAHVDHTHIRNTNLNLYNKVTKMFPKSCVVLIQSVKSVHKDGNLHSGMRKF